jgi:general stress protein 26
MWPQSFILTEKSKAMGEVKHLESNEAVGKLQHLAEEIGTCMFCTRLSYAPFHTRPMALQSADEHGNLWFLSSAESEKNFEIKKNEKVQLIFSKPSDSHYLNVYGEAQIITDDETIDEVWTGIAKAWFKEGKNDPDVTVICVRPIEAYYWDTKNGKMISLIKIAAAAVTGKVMDGGVEGKLVV